MTQRRIAAAVGPALLLLAALLPGLRPVLALVLAVGWAVLRRMQRPEAIAWAAVVPVAVALAWAWIVGADVPIGERACVDPLSVVALRRLLLAAVILLSVGVLAVIHRASAAELGLRRPARSEALFALGGGIVLSVGGLFIGPAIAQPFFGALSFPVPPAAIVPGILFGLANGILEEVAYRGAMQAWLGRLLPMPVAIVFQGLIFGIVHAGPEVVALLPLHIALLSLVGTAGGVVRWRTGSLAIPIGVHVGADIALYVGLACRAAA